MTKYQSIPVPEEHIPQVMAFMARLFEAASPALPQPPDGEEVNVPNNGRWSRADCEALAGRGNERHLAILRCIAQASVDGSEATVDDLMDAVRPFSTDPVPHDYSMGNLRADLAWVAKYAKAVKRERVVPWVHSGQSYRMPVAIAHWWLDIT